jgi:hypothetical protein
LCASGSCLDGRKRVAGALQAQCRRQLTLRQCPSRYSVAVSHEPMPPNQLAVALWYHARSAYVHRAVLLPTASEHYPLGVVIAFMMFFLRPLIGGLIAVSLVPWIPLAGQSPAWEPLLLIARTKASVRFDPNGSSNGDRSGIAPAIGIVRHFGRGAIRIELTVVQKGFERTQPTWHWTYLELPVLLEFRSASERAAVQPVAQIGLAPSVALRCTVRYVGVNGPYSGDCRDRDPLGLLASPSMTDLGLVLGAGLRIRTGRQRLLLELRANRGLTTVERQSQHRVYSAGLGFAFPAAR